MSDVDYGPQFRPQGVDWKNADQTVGTVNFQDKNTHAIFFMKDLPNPAKSQQMGRPISDNVPFVRIGNPGERLNIVVRPATSDDRRRFALQWAQFQQNVEQRPSGTPVSLLFPNNPAVIGLLEGSNVWTVEQLAELSANGIENVGMGCQSYVNQAQSYLKMAEKGIKHAEFQSQIRERDQKIDQLTQNVQELNATVTKLLRQINQRGAQAAQTQQVWDMERPVHMPQVAFDPQEAQIAAAGRDTRPAPKRAAKAAEKPRRERVRLNDGD